ncbi:unnamed protein product [Didymodactylos carnosus]|uniref:PSP proline-rich domain-containing protein n=1 Tax=Didymodactylos carnosus TaxID=1234261 RepID=A0A814B0W1_9BILA|nr:unnamed protein product [Didymodactylos carnosus]CAF1025704.1 unnamed protein product [Didymodactylos carnosus]CAF3699794.1 unnamed protein product [Didymodactylos carnosus]CAF3794146.1 unnamed protein product [Didymodactylos carnosus]
MSNPPDPFHSFLPQLPPPPPPPPQFVQLMPNIGQVQSGVAPPSLPPFDRSVPGRNSFSSQSSQPQQTTSSITAQPLMSISPLMTNNTDTHQQRSSQQQIDNSNFNAKPSSNKETGSLEKILHFRDTLSRDEQLKSQQLQTDKNTTDNNEDESDENEDTGYGSAISTNKKKDENRKRRRQKKKKKTKNKNLNGEEKLTPTIDQQEMNGDENNENIIIEYVQEELPIQKGDQYYTHFVKVFQNFKIDQSKSGNDPNSKEAKLKIKSENDKQVLPRDRTMIDQDDEEEEQKEKAQQADDALHKKSKKQLKKETRLSVAQLKQLVSRPDVVEMYDVTARDPKLLVFLKATRNTVPVPRHWCAKRKYLQGKRGIEKPPFQLPEFIRRTGIMEMREALQEKEQNKTLKQKMREKVRPKLGKIDIDYQKLHDAFFRWQTKPRMSIHGDLYYEGKENETRLKDKKPGLLGEELRVALGIPVGPAAEKYPPPWLIAMQRYGPPPSYPNLKVPGLNAPIPENCQFGYHSGGWGKPPVDEHGRPLYGDVFGTNQYSYMRVNEEEYVDKSYWGELDVEETNEELLSSSEEDGEGTEEETGETAVGDSGMATTVEGETSAVSDGGVSGFATPSEGFITPSGTASTVTQGVETPQQFEIRKSRFHQEMDGIDTPQTAYHVIPERSVPIAATSLLAPGKMYDFTAAKKVGMDSTLGTSSRNDSGVDIALNPDDIDLSAQTIETRYRQELKDKELQKEDLSDMVADHVTKQNKKRKHKQTDTKTKKHKEFKF